MKEIESYGIEIDFYKTMILIKDEILVLSTRIHTEKTKKEIIAKVKDNMRYAKRILLRYTKNDDIFNLEFVSQYLDWTDRELGCIREYKNHSFDLYELEISDYDDILETLFTMDKYTNKENKKKFIEIRTITRKLNRNFYQSKTIHNVYTLPVMTIRKGHGYLYKDLLNNPNESVIKPLNWEVVKKLKKEIRRVVLGYLKTYTKLLKYI